MEFREGARLPVKVVSGTGAVTLGSRPVDAGGNEFSDEYVRLWTGDREVEPGDRPGIVTAELIRTDTDLTQGRIVDESPNVGQVYREWRRALEARGDGVEAPSETRTRGPSGPSRLERPADRDEPRPVDRVGGDERADGKGDRTSGSRSGYEDEWKKRKSDSMRNLL